MIDKYFLSEEDTLLVIIDIQKKLLPVINGNRDILKNAEKLVKIFKIFNMPIIITEQYPKGLGETVDEIKNLLTDEKLIEKVSFSAYQNIKNEIKEKNKNKIVISGIESHICVFQTVRDLLKEGYEVYIAVDAVGSRKENNSKNAIKIMQDMGAIVMNTEMIIYDVVKTAECENFKEISKLLK